MKNKKQLKKIRRYAEVISLYASVTENQFIKERADAILKLCQQNEEKSEW
jgi:hypothetical protein